MSNVKLITISGLDGSGKSTQVEMLKKHLESQGKAFYYFHAVDFSVANRLLGKKKDKSGEEKSVTKANFIQIILRRIALLIDVLRFRRIYLRGKGEFEYIISDRYFYDSLVNLIFLTGFDLPCLAECFIPRPDLTFYLQVDPERIMQRDRRPDQGMEYLESKKTLFDGKIHQWQMIALDGSKSKEEIFEIIRSKIQDQDK